ncbi:MAG: IMP cyclohydrolase [Deltaproteobacteria bacterium]|nr:IMP cyclohydrolase [Deltaproteobacteria bacterium]
MARIRRAIVSVSDKTGVVDFARGLADRGVQVLSTGGTAKSLKEAGVPVVEVSAYTGFPEMLDGRVKTLHPKIHGGILGLRDNPAHAAKMQEHGIEPIDLVAVNLYPFEKTVAQEGCTLPEAVEQIDIGGPCMIRASAKNHRFVTVVVDPGDYAAVLAEMDRLEGEVSGELNFRLAVKAFQRTSQYDSAIAAWLGGAGRS